MGLLKDFKEFQEIKKGKMFLTNELYIAELGTITVFEDENYIHSNFDFDRYVIVIKATGEEINKHLIKKYGKSFGKPDINFIKSKFERPDKTTYYKLITMNNRLMASATTASIIDSADTGKYEVIRKAKTLNGFKRNKFIRFADTIDLESIKDIEELINHELDFSM